MAVPLRRGGGKGHAIKEKKNFFFTFLLNPAIFLRLSYKLCKVGFSSALSAFTLENRIRP